MSLTAVVVPTTIRVRTTDGISLALDVWEPLEYSHRPQMPTVLLAHGGGQTRHSWKSAGAMLAAEGCRASSLDLRGHGDSEWSPDGDYRFDRIAQDVSEVATELGGRVVLVGASLGGLASLLASAQLADRVAALVLVDVTPRIEQAGVAKIRGFMENTIDGFATLEEAAVAIGEYLSHRSRQAVTAGLAKNLRQRSDGTWRWHWDPAFVTNRNPDARSPEEAMEQAAARLRAPTLLVRGLLSDVVSDAGVDALRALIPTIRYTEIQGAAHTAAGDDNDAFVSAVLDFLRAEGVLTPRQGE